jgi:PAT family beta-lactamase induction signal transducer AmpG
MLAATLTTRLSEAGIQKRSISAFALSLLVYSFKWAWAPLVDRVHIPFVSRQFGQRRAWLWLTGLSVIGAVIVLGSVNPAADIRTVAYAAILLGFCGATFDIVIDAYRIELLKPEQLGTGSGMSQYGWRIGSAVAAVIALTVAARSNWTIGYIACAPLALSALMVSLVMGEPRRRHEAPAKRGAMALVNAFVSPLKDFFTRPGSVVVLLFVLVHKIGDTMANLMIRDLLVQAGFTKDEIAFGDVGVGFIALLAGIFVGGILYARFGLKYSVMISLILMAVSNISFAFLAAMGHSMPMLAFTIGFENFSSGIGGVVVVAYLSALCNLSFTATQFALLSAAAAIVGRFLTGTTAGALIETFGYVQFYLLTTVLALPGVIIYWFMLRSGLVERSVGSAATKL